MSETRAGKRYTYFELSPTSDAHYYAVITTRSGFEYYVAGFRSRHAAYRFAKSHPLQGR